MSFFSASLFFPLRVGWYRASYRHFCAIFLPAIFLTKPSSLRHSTIAAMNRMV